LIVANVVGVVAERVWVVFEGLAVGSIGGCMSHVVKIISVENTDVLLLVVPQASSGEASVGRLRRLR
jgi:hypothetical protein